MKYPLITIGITCYNAENTVARALESARAQDWPNCEIIVVDDCSTDNSVAVIEKTVKRDKKISMRRHDENRGVAAARNTIIEHARGEYIAFFDDDDVSRKSRISEQYERIRAFGEQHPGAPVLCYCNQRVFRDGVEQKQGFGTIMGHKGIGHAPPEPHGGMIADFFFLRVRDKAHVFGGAACATAFAATDDFRKFRFDENLRRGEDWDLAIRVGLAGGYCIAVNRQLVDYHLTDTADKAGRIALDYDLALVAKHKTCLRPANIHLAAICHAHARFYRTRNRIKLLFYLSLACLLSPRVLAATVRAALGR